MILVSALLFGVISSLHCIGMCGPIAMMLPVSHDNPKKKALQVLTYHSGRISAYATIGGIFGVIGRGFYLAGWQQQLSVITGILMIVIVLIPEKTFAKYNGSLAIFRLISKMKSALGKQLQKASFSSLFTTGLLNGLLPCGMVYAAVFGALAMQNVFGGMLYMTLFGLGTIPLMTAVVFLNGMLKLRFRNVFQKAIPVAVCAIGILFILRGSGLDIPFLSPSNVSLHVMAHPDCH